ncbi:hypothetical protein RFI_06221 [Reticulomyxa filosa]|uniref:Uncharacterized protein n=1 Tax=Reticulomyxa filosa TaxID=46433 RepID=X6NY69_RETFI|nr:hypothetical protein RFI_06221 [Reticulomyxa filosa]|eukprot:ETO30901.1 hypothetical protein RFI_06221 [Reticulomyxa filosa]
MKKKPLCNVLLRNNYFESSGWCLFADVVFDHKVKATIYNDETQLNVNRILSCHNNKDSIKLLGGMQDQKLEQGRYATEMKALLKLCTDIIDKKGEEEVKKKLEENNGNIGLAVEKMIATLLNSNSEIQDEDPKTKKIEEPIEDKINEQKTEDEKIEEKPSDKIEKKEEEIEEIGETKPGINLQGYCVNKDCLASKAKLLVWVNIGFDAITFIPDKTFYNCPNCKQSTVASVVKVLFLDSEHSICDNDTSLPTKSNHYQCYYSIKFGLTYQLQARKILQHAINLEDLITRSENAILSTEIINLMIELQKHLITVVKPLKVKDRAKLLEQIHFDYGNDCKQAFDVGRFTILCDNPTQLQSIMTVIKKAEQFNLIVSEDEDFFTRQSKTHYRFHSVKLYVPKYDVYVEMQATLKKFTTLEGYSDIENPKLSHLFYEYIRGWKPSNTSEEELKQASDVTLIKFNDIICEWIDEKEIKKIATRFKPHSEIRILKPPQLKNKTEEQINASNDISLILTKFVYDQLCKFNPIHLKGKAIYVILFEYFKKYIMGEMNPASCADVVLILKNQKNKN